MKRRRRPTMKERREAEADILPWAMMGVAIIMLGVYVLEQLGL